MRSLMLVFVLLITGMSVPSVRAQDSDCRSFFQPMVAQAGHDLNEVSERLWCRPTSSGRWTEVTIGAKDAVEYVTYPGATGDYIESYWDELNQSLEKLYAFVESRDQVSYEPESCTVSLPSIMSNSDTRERVRICGEPFTYDPPMTYAIRAPYASAVLEYVFNNPSELAAIYVYWFARDRDFLINSLTTQLPPPVRDSVYSMYGYGTIPWPWELSDAVWMKAFLAWSQSAG